MQIEITRMVSNSAFTMGVLLINSKLVCFTLEPPWRMNKRGLSCIPVGQYAYKKYMSEKYNRECLKLYNVYGRDFIAMHPGNKVVNTKGCILPGLQIGELDGKDAVLKSDLAMKRIMRRIPDSKFVVCSLTIRNGF